ncbi:MAG: acetate--CoA ligase family protein [Microthrixaceae bacterium]|nr:acetate--CoA ligase family protein [Microthrixaceae bacterium]
MSSPASSPLTRPATHTLSEAESKAFLEPFGVSIAPERVVATAEAAVAAAEEIGWPVVAKLCGDTIAHKTERGLVRLHLTGADATRQAAQSLLDAALPDDGEVGVLVAAMISGTRELIAGVARDPQFGLTVMVGIGGVLAEAIGDVAVGLVPITTADAHEMIDALESVALLGEFRGEPAVDREALAAVLVALSDAAASNPAVHSIDLNPLIIANGTPIAVDALVELTTEGTR